jgi:hypothetical protein
VDYHLRAVKHFSAAGDAVARFELDREAGILQAHGDIFDEVCHLDTATWKSHTQTPAWEDVVKWLTSSGSFIHRHDTKSYTPSELLEWLMPRLADTPSSESVWTSEAAPLLSAYETLCLMLRFLHIAWQEAWIHKYISTERSQDLAWLIRSCRSFTVHRLCVSKNGYVGIVTATGRPDDKLALLSGGRSIFVLRECTAGLSTHTNYGPAENSTTYKIVSQAFFLDLMNGEILNRHEFVPVMLNIR